MHLRLFKNNGVVRYDQVLRIPSSERIPALTITDAGWDQVYTILVVRLQQAFSNLNLRKGFNEDQLLNLAEMIIDSSSEDNLSLEDVLLFLQQLVEGKCGKIFDRMDAPTFFELFEDYRERRHMALQYIQYEAHQQYKALGDNTRTSEQLAYEDLSIKRQMQEYNIRQEVKKQANEQSVRPDVTTGGPVTQ